MVSLLKRRRWIAECCKQHKPGQSIIEHSKKFPGAESFLKNRKALHILTTMIIRFTEKLAKKIKTGKLPNVELHSNPYLDWHAHLFTQNQSQYIIIVNSYSLLPVIIRGRGISDFDGFMNSFLDTLHEVLKEIDCEMVFQRVIAPSPGIVQPAKSHGRQVLGSMNDMIRLSKAYKNYEEFSLRDTGLFLMKTPFSMLDMESPIDIFQSMKVS